MKTQLLREDQIDLAARLIRQGKLVAFPTETVYGLGADGLCEESVKKIYAAKGRPADNPLILHIADVKELDPLVGEVSKTARALMDAFWPGPLTLVFSKSDLIPKSVSGGLSTVAIRLPSHPLARALVRAAQRPIAAPSANRSGRPSPTSAAHVLADLDGRIDAIVCGGPLEVGLESTIIDVSGPKACLLRPGGVTLEEIEKIIGPLTIDAHLLGFEGVAKAPGMKYRHYAPRAQVVLLRGSHQAMVHKMTELIQSAQLALPVALMASEECCQLASGELKDLTQLSLGSGKDLSEVARRIYGRLRQADDLGIGTIFVEYFPEDHLGRTIMNRLLKAANDKVVDCR